MHSITHLSQKLLQERAHANANQPLPPDMAPPPYSESDSDACGEDEDDDDDDDDDYNVVPGSPPIRLVINSAHSIQGSNNLVPTSPAPLADASKFSTLLLHAVNSMNNANLVGNASARPWRPLKLHLTINCGITIIGDRNVVGNVGLKPKASSNAANLGTSTAAVAGAKRKADESAEGEGEPAQKKLTLSDRCE